MSDDRSDLRQKTKFPLTDFIVVVLVLVVGWWLWGFWWGILAVFVVSAVWTVISSA